MVIALSPEEYLTAIRDAAKLRIAGGTIYDALLLKCAQGKRGSNLHMEREALRAGSAGSGSEDCDAVSDGPAKDADTSHRKRLCEESLVAQLMGRSIAGFCIPFDSDCHM